MEENFRYDSWFAVSLSFVFWGLMYFISRKIFPQQSPEYSSRVVTLGHGILMAFYGLNQCFTGNSPFSHPEEPTTSEQAFIIVLSLGYFLVDLIWCLYYQTESVLMVAHHTYSCFALLRMLFRGFSGHQVACGLGALEVTNPLLQARWFIRSHGMHNTSLFTSVEVTFMILFFLIRILLGTIYVLMAALQPQNSWEYLILTGFIYVVSWMFMINISKYFSHKYMKQNVEAELGHINTS